MGHIHNTSNIHGLTIYHTYHTQACTSIYADTWPLTPVQTRLVSANEVLMRPFPIPFTLLSMLILRDSGRYAYNSEGVAGRYSKRAWGEH